MSQVWRVRRVPTQLSAAGEDRNGPGPDMTQAHASTRVLEGWAALEALSPQTFRRPEDFLTARRSQVVVIRNNTLDWFAEVQRRPDHRIFHHVILGEVQLGRAYAKLREAYPDGGPDSPEVARQAILGVILCDHHGVPKLDQVSISSFAWAVPLALKRELRKLADWPTEEQRLLKALRARFALREDGSGPLPLTHESLMDVQGWLLKELGLEAELVKPPSFFLRESLFHGYREPPDSLLLNSFFLTDLARARKSVADGKVPATLRRYLGALPQGSTRDILRDTAVCSELLSPRRTPLGRWPGPGRRPLVVLQQAAVNAVMSSAPGDVTAVNGPPGTGKTTLLADIVAAVMVARAEVLASFDEPRAAFSRTGIKIARARTKLELRSISKRLRGFEIVVASSNNRAVENVSAELPSFGAIAEDLPELRYFSSIATSLRKDASWGLIAAVLGNAANVNTFFDGFWNDEDQGMEAYLATAAGTPRVFTDKSGVTRIPRVVLEEKPPSGPEEAQKQWVEAKRAFEAALSKIRTLSTTLEGVHAAQTRIPVIRANRVKLWDERKELFREQTCLAEERSERGSDAQRARLTMVQHNTELEQHLKTRPGLAAQLFSRQAHEGWKGQEAVLRSRLARTREEARRAEEALQRTETSLQALSERLAEIDRTLVQEQEELQRQNEPWHKRGCRRRPPRSCSPRHTPSGIKVRPGLIPRRSTPVTKSS
jgi:hypothetical protein